MDARQMIVEGQSILLKDQTARDAITDAYDNTATYAVGDFCIYNNTLYKCTTAVSTAEDFDSTKWTVTQIDDELSQLKSSLVNLSTVESSSSSGTIAVNGTYQIPSNILGHSIIIVQARRQGNGNSAIFLKNSLLAMDNGFELMASTTEGYRIKCSSTGLLTLVDKTSGLNDPYIEVIGIF